MRVDAVRLHLLHIPFKGAFEHALKRRTEAETVIVVLRTAAGTVGVGEIAPRSYLTGETIDRVLDEAAPAQARRCLGETLATRDQVVTWLRTGLERAGRDLATFGGFELAMLDAAGQELGFTFADVLGGAAGPELPAGIVLGFEVATRALKKQCALARLAGRRHVKVKVGRADDLERLEIISHTLGKDLPLRLDANGAWSVPEAIERLKVFGAVVNVASIEQPVAGDDLAGLRRVRLETGVKVMADESLCSVEDGRRLIAAEAVDIFNVRIGKCGGVLGSLRLVELARSAGLGLHLGALVGETAVLSRAAEIFGRHVPELDCLEGKGQNRFLLEGDIASEVEGRAGLGLELQEDALRRYERRREEQGASILPAATA